MFTVHLYDTLIHCILDKGNLGRVSTVYSPPVTITLMYSDKEFRDGLRTQKSGGAPHSQNNVFPCFPSI